MSNVEHDLREGDWELAIPGAAALIESMRAYGYSTSTAIADLIDNSVTAGASRVELEFTWNGRESHFTLLDNGRGMPEAELAAAMRPGSKSPLEMRSPEDLGRFGLGLKTASFSQCRKLTVASKALGTARSVRQWDLDVVRKTDRWVLKKIAVGKSGTLATKVDGLPSGTIVIWEDLDRLVGDETVDDEVAHKRFLSETESVERYLAMVFHAYLEGERPQLEIFINAQKVVPWDPYSRSNHATVCTPIEPIDWRGNRVQVQGFVLPHHDKMTSQEHALAAGIAGWGGQQGFYVYRNRRLLVAGGWLGLGRPRRWTQDQQFVLARIRVDIPNSQDHEWQIDIRKATAKPPAWLRARLEAIAAKVRSGAREVFVHRGGFKRLEKEGFLRAWRTEMKGEKVRYRIDRSHPLIKEAIRTDTSGGENVKAALRIVEETVPVAQIWLNVSEDVSSQGRPFDDPETAEIRRLIRKTFEILHEREGLTSAAAKERLRSMEEFSGNDEFIEDLGL